MKIIKQDQDIKCECGRKLGEYKDGWLRTDARKILYSSDGIIHKFKCEKCNHITEIKILKQQS